MRGQEDHEESSLSESNRRTARMSTGLLDGERHRSWKELDVGTCIVLRDILVVRQIKTKIV